MGSKNIVTMKKISEGFKRKESKRGVSIVLSIQQ